MVSNYCLLKDEISSCSENTTCAGFNVMLMNTPERDPERSERDREVDKRNWQKLCMNHMS